MFLVAVSLWSGSDMRGAKQELFTITASYSSESIQISKIYSSVSSAI